MLQASLWRQYLSLKRLIALRTTVWIWTQPVGWLWKRVPAWRLRLEVGVTYSCRLWQSSCHRCNVWIEFRNSCCRSPSTEVETVISPPERGILAQSSLPRSHLFSRSLTPPAPLTAVLLSKWVIFLEMFFRVRASSCGACPGWLLLSSFPLRSPSLIDHLLVVFTLSCLIDSPCVPHRRTFPRRSLSLSYSVSFFFRLFLSGVSMEVESCY